jgi:hypothetical protein
MISSIQDFMDLQYFLDLSDEAVFDDIEHLDEQIIAQFEPTDEKLDNEGEILRFLPIISVSEAPEALKKHRYMKNNRLMGIVRLSGI